MLSALFTSGPLKNKTLNNRLIVAPMTRISAKPDGQASKTMQHYYERFALGNFGGIITEGIYIDEHYSQGYYHQPGLANDQHSEAWEPIVETVQTQGSIFIAQLMHAGEQSQGNVYTNERISPSGIAPKGKQLEFYGGKGPFSSSRSLTDQDITQVQKAFVDSAQRAKKAGFDGVEIHGANGYLLDEFLTEYMNHRQDDFGGSLDNRLRLSLDIIQAVRKAVGYDFIVGIRISQIKVSDSAYQWANGEKDAQHIFERLGATSLDYIHVTDSDATQPAFGENTRTLTQAAKTFSTLPVIVNGGLGNIEKAHTLLAEGDADFIALGTSALANPDLPNKLAKDQALISFDFAATLLPKAEIKDHELQMPLSK